MTWIRRMAGVAVFELALQCLRLSYRLHELSARLYDRTAPLRPLEPIKEPKRVKSPWGT
ncbi:MAG: hypothetical protein AMXMBFR84_25980 [Candidatus Hydrogenedentota bacterium]